MMRHLSLLLLLIVLLLPAARPSAARPWRGSRAISVLLCKPKGETGDVPSPYNDKAYYEKMIYQTGKGGLADYWKVVSYGQYNNKDSEVRDWVTMDFTKAQEVCPPRCVDTGQCDSACSIIAEWPACHGCQRWARAEDCIAAHKTAGYTAPEGNLVLVITWPDLDYWGSSGWGAYLSYDGVTVSGLAHELGHGINLQHPFSNDPDYRNADWAAIGEYDDPWSVMSYGNCYTTPVSVDGGKTLVATGPSLSAYEQERMGWLPIHSIYTMGANGEAEATVVIKATNAYTPVDPPLLLPTKIPTTAATCTAATVAPTKAMAAAETAASDHSSTPADTLAQAHTVSQGEAAAAGALPRANIQPRPTDFTTIPNPSLEVLERNKKTWETVPWWHGWLELPKNAKLDPNDPAAKGEVHLMVRVPFDINDANHYYTVEYRRKTGINAGIPWDHQILIHEVKNRGTADNPSYHPYLLRDLTSSGKAPATSWVDATNGIHISTKSIVDGFEDYAAVTIRSNFTRRCKSSYVWREACRDDFVCVTRAERNANKWANDNPRTNSITGFCQVNYYPRMACGARDPDVCVDKPSKLRVERDNGFAAGRVKYKKAVSYGPNKCKSPYVWREADPFDWVCVERAVRTQVAADNSKRWERYVPGVGDNYGLYECQVGYVWREAFIGDFTCVDKTQRDQAKADNTVATDHDPDRWRLELPAA